MPTYRSTPEFEHGLSGSTGVLVVNLGTPDAPETGAVRRFLRQFLSDPRVVEYPRLLWLFILNCIILLIRPSRSAAAYRKIWTAEGSPLMVHSVALADRLRDELAKVPDRKFVVELGMTYGTPSIPEAFDKLLAAGARRIVTLPLYPQYSATTTAAVFDAVVSELRQQRWIPEPRFINNYHDDDAYIEALASTVRESWASNGRGDMLLMSFHGIPKSALLRGDPYHCHCQKTARLLAEKLELGDGDWTLSFQSRVGREEWLGPYTEETVRELGARKLRQLDVVCPGFSTDCLETLEEIAMQNDGFFRAAGGGGINYIPALNARSDHVDALAKIVLRHASGWDEMQDAVALDASARRAIAMGATR